MSSEHGALHVADAVELRRSSVYAMLRCSVGETGNMFAQFIALSTKTRLWIASLRGFELRKCFVNCSFRLKQNVGENIWMESILTVEVILLHEYIQSFIVTFAALKPKRNSVQISIIDTAQL